MGVPFRSGCSSSGISELARKHFSWVLGRTEEDGCEKGPGRGGCGEA